MPTPLRGQLGLSGAVPGSPLMSGFSGLQVRSLEAHMYPEKLKVIAQQVQLQQQQEQVRLLHQEKLEREQQIRTQVSAPQTRPGVKHGVGSVMDLAPPVGSNVPAKLSAVVIWERGGPKPCTVLGAVLEGTPCFREGLWVGPPVVASKWLHLLAQRSLCRGGHLLSGRVSSRGLHPSLVKNFRDPQTTPCHPPGWERGVSSWQAVGMGTFSLSPETAGSASGAGRRRVLCQHRSLCAAALEPSPGPLQQLQRKEQQLLPPSLGFCRAVSLQGPCQPPPGEVQPIFR